MLLHISNLILSRVLFAVSGVLFWFVAARFYSVEEIGVAAGVISAGSFIIFLSSFGLQASIGRFLPQEKDKGQLIGSLFIGAVFIFVFLCVLFYGIVALWADNLSFLLSPIIFCLFFMFCFMMLVFQMGDAVLLGFKQTTVILVKNTIHSFLRIGCLPFLVFLGGFGIYAANGIMAAIVLLAVYLYLIKKEFFRILRFSFKLRVIKDLVSFSSVNFLNSLSLSVPGMLLPTIILVIFSKQEAGYFYIPWMTFSVYAGFIMVVLSVLVVEAAHVGQYKHLLRKVSSMLLVLVLVGSFVFICFGDVILLLFGREFSLYSFSILKILFYSLSFFAMNQTYLSVKNIKKDVYCIGVFSAIVLSSLVVFSTRLVPVLGSEGIAISWLLANIVGTFAIVINTIKSKYISK